jgi:hypothetical protein
MKNAKWERHRLEGEAPDENDACLMQNQPKN